MLLLIIIGNTFAEENRVRKKYINLSFSKNELKHDNFLTLKSNYGIAFTVGRTYFVHKKPILNMIRFGIDATWFDINYTNYKLNFLSTNQYSPTETSNYHQADIGMQVGPSITVNPISKLNVQGYFRFAPSFSGIYLDDQFYGNYASFFVSGGTISFGVIGLGIEYHFGNCKYKEMLSSDEDEVAETFINNKTTFKGVRTCLSFRF